MKTVIIILAIVCFILMGALSYSIYTSTGTIAGLNDQVKALKSQSDNLTAQLQEEKDNNTVLSKQAYPRSFATPREMSTWLQANKPLTAGEYYSNDAMAMLNLARNDGVWMGLMPIKIDSYSSTLTVPIDGGGYVFCVAVVADGTFYLIDPSDGNFKRLTSMSAEFKWDDTTKLSKNLH